MKYSILRNIYKTSEVSEKICKHLERNLIIQKAVYHYVRKRIQGMKEEKNLQLSETSWQDSS